MLVVIPNQKTGVPVFRHSQLPDATTTPAHPHSLALPISSRIRSCKAFTLIELLVVIVGSPNNRDVLWFAERTTSLSK
ncbi:MAG: type II secretion system protein [Verrucomicrobiales bacterium]|nr:type II secretion system protein [Verrucomicrobiales bacterium]